jgi:HSP20 family protein
MTLAKWKKDDVFPSYFPSLFDDFFGRDVINGLATGTTLPAVNINEEKDHFEIEVAAPGMKKEDFTLNLENNILTISAEKEEKEEKKDKKLTRKEFSFTSFQRSFTLPDSVNSENIQATYKDGVLLLTLPKKEDMQQNTSKRSVSTDNVTGKAGSCYT